MMFQCVDFEFNFSNPTELIDPYTELANLRKNLLDYYLNKFLTDLEIKQFK